MAKEYRDWARLNLKLRRYELTEDDLALLSETKHPLQKDITREMALENLIHVADDFGEIRYSVRSLLSSWDMKDIQGREPELHAFLMSYTQEHQKEKYRELSLRLSIERE